MIRRKPQDLKGLEQVLHEFFIIPVLQNCGECSGQKMLKLSLSKGIGAICGSTVQSPKTSLSPYRSSPLTNVRRPWPGQEHGCWRRAQAWGTPALPAASAHGDLISPCTVKAQHKLSVPGMYLGHTVFSTDQKMSQKQSFKECVYSVFFILEKKIYFKLRKMMVNVKREAQTCCHTSGRVQRL